MIGSLESLSTATSSLEESVTKLQAILKDWLSLSGVELVVQDVVKSCLSTEVNLVSSLFLTFPSALIHSYSSSTKLLSPTCWKHSPPSATLIEQSNKCLTTICGSNALQQLCLLRIGPLLTLLRPSNMRPC